MSLMSLINESYLNKLDLNKLNFELSLKNGAKILVGIAGAVFIHKTLRIYLRRRKYKHIPGPPTKGILGFYFGNYQEFLNQEVLHLDVFEQWRKTYGELFKYQAGDDIVIFTTNREAVKEILVTKDYPRNPKINEIAAFPFNERLLGRGLFTDVNYNRWRERRTMFNHGFYRDVLMTMLDDFNQKVDILLERLSKSADGKTPVTLLPEFVRLLLDSISNIGFSMNTDTKNGLNDSLNKSMKTITLSVKQLVEDPFFTIKPWNFQKISQTKKEIYYLRKQGREVISERIKSFQDDEHLPNDILTRVLKMSKEEKIDVEMLIDDFVTLLFAGQGTTSNTIAFAFQELGLNPSTVQKAREEINSVLGERTYITYADFTQLKYCTCVFKETLRLHSIADFIYRNNNEEMNISGYKIPTNTNLTVSPYISSRLEQSFEHALEFKPERFIKDSSDKGIDNYAYFPFSLGPRNCIGQVFAQVQGVIVIAKFLQKFDFKLDPTQSFKATFNLELSPKDGTRVFLTNRS